MSQQLKNLVTLEGVIRLKVINTPAFFTRMALEARALFKAPDAHELFANVKISPEGTDNDSLIPPVFSEQATKLAMKYMMTGGTALEFIPAKVVFDAKERITVRYDVLSEVTIKDGIVTKIANVPLPHES